jgi:hypothetical protein
MQAAQMPNWRRVIIDRHMTVIVGNYAYFVVDECHHLSAVSFELVARRSKARYILGLSATVTRKDGHHPITVMQCGPIRHRVDARSEAAKRPFDHLVQIRDTSFQRQAKLNTPSRSIHDVFKQMVDDKVRNDLIFDDFLRALEAGRSHCLAHPHAHSANLSEPGRALPSATASASFAVGYECISNCRWRRCGWHAFPTSLPERYV